LEGHNVKKVLVLLAALVAFATAALPAGAVLYGTPDNNAHPYVGMLRFYDAQGNYLWRCTGTLLDGNTVLTAGHCVFGATTARFYPVEMPPARPAADTQGIVGTPIPFPGYDDFATFPNTSDVGVVQLSSSVAGPYATLAPLNALDGLDKHQLFDIVGYGVQDVRPVQVANLQRVKGQAKLVNAKSGYSAGFNLQLSSNRGQPHQGGLCFGDSGGPVLLGNVVYGVNSFVINGNCAGAGFSYRTDINPVHDWIVSQI
jgi:secreted trypsin-like serine protease